MINNTSLRALAGISLAGVSLVALSACGSSSPSSSNSPSTSPSAAMTEAATGLKARLAEAKVCLQVGKDFQTALPVFAKVTSGKETPAQALAALKPMAMQVDALAKANASLPIGPALTKLSTDIAAAQKAPAKTPAAIKAQAALLTGDATAALMHCAK